MDSAAAYRLETSRPRQRPDPLHFEQSSYKSISALSSHRPSSPPLLYDVPAPISVSPPTSPRSKGRLISPTSGRPTPPPNRNRSLTPLGVVESDLEKFAGHCRAWYFNQDEDAGHQMTQALATLPPSQRASYARLQASIRASYHRSISARRTAEFRALLSATQPGGSLLPHSRANPLSNAARKERYDRFERFLRTWCTMGMPGPQPFFQALWALMRLQVVPQQLGGAGAHRIEWEIDDAVFKEAGGKDFMLEAIDILKGVLAFEEIPSPRKSCSSSKAGPSDIVHSRSQSQPLSSVTHSVRPVVPKRARAPSDPFLDTPALSQSVGSSHSSQSDANSTLLPSLVADNADDPPSPVSTCGDEYILSSRMDNTGDAVEDEEFLRIWTSPDLSNPEYLDLLKPFPSFITRRTLPRFPDKVTQGDIEEGYNNTIAENGPIQCGTGSMWVGPKQRSAGWEGGWWSRFIVWWKKTFC
ncbi:hypothetical protein BDZ89DRAFT_1154082 [Hymenopellis radicata]|nr:hypothetical protein BDZ89DRAFT_1154082 [Hymenopellis radicata]